MRTPAEEACDELRVGSLASSGIQQLVDLSEAVSGEEEMAWCRRAAVVPPRNLVTGPAGACRSVAHRAEEPTDAIFSENPEHALVRKPRFATEDQRH